MKSFELKSPNEAVKEIAKIFDYELSQSKSNQNLVILCRDESAFIEGDKTWLKLGDIWLPPWLPPLTNKDASSSNRLEMISKFTKIGAFEMSTPSIDEAKEELSKALAYKPEENDQVETVLADISSIAVRAGLVQPSFDPVALEDMPYKRPITIVADTSGVLQGGLDFVAKFLYPAARVKIPTIVNVELTNAAGNFFSCRRTKEDKKKNNGRRRELVEHLKSQGGQRALLRLELQADTEVERTFILGDPFRDAFKPDKDSGLNDLNLTKPFPAYADRLILEAARQHQAQTSPTHEVRLLTADQGLARVALAEGITPLYFGATKPDKLFGKRLTGRTLHPFTGKVQSISLATILWELATAFGEARIESKDGESNFTVCALGKDISWSPYHSLDDLLWCSTEVIPSQGEVASYQSGNKDNSTRSEQESQGKMKKVPLPLSKNTAKAIDLPTAKKDVRAVKPVISKNKITFFNFNVEKLFQLICELDNLQEMSVADVVKSLDVKTVKTMDEYKRFLLSAGFLQIEGKIWKANNRIKELSAALRNGHSENMHKCLLKAPSYEEFVRRVDQLKVGQVLDREYFGRSINTYRILGEISCICVEVRDKGDKGIYATSNHPATSVFAPLAIQRFVELEDGDGLVETGAWLEALIQQDGIHPVIARSQLDQASRDGLILRSTEGSTTQIKNNDHIFHLLRVSSGLPKVEKIHLHRGDFLIPGKASVSLRIKGAKS